MFLDPEERDAIESDITPAIKREIVKARMSGKSVIINLPSGLREPLKIHPGCKLMITLDEENQRLIVTKE